MVILVEVSRKAYLASIVPVIVDAILNEHQIVVDIVAFVNRGDFPRSRLGEKQRGKILAGWVTRKMRTVAQFAIRDPDSGSVEGGDGAMDNHRASVGSVRSSNAPGASSLRNMEHAPQILEQEELDHQMNKMSALPQPGELVAGNERPIGAAQSVNTYAARGALNNAYEFANSDRYGGGPAPAKHQQPRPPQIRLPSVDGRETPSGTMWAPGQGASQPRPSGEEDEWQRDALMHMNLANQMPRQD